MWEDRVCNQFFVWLEASVVFWVLVWCVGILRCLWWRVPMSFETQRPHFSIWMTVASLFNLNGSGLTFQFKMAVTLFEGLQGINRVFGTTIIVCCPERDGWTADMIAFSDLWMRQGSICGETREGSELDFWLNQKGLVKTMGLTDTEGRGNQKPDKSSTGMRLC